MSHPQETQPKKSPNILKWLGIGCGITLILLGGIFITLGYLSKKALDTMMNPEAAEKTAKSIMEYDIPNGSKGVFLINVGNLKMAQVVSNNEPPEVELTLAEFTADFQGKEEEMKKSLENQTQKNHKNNFKVEFTRTEKKQLCSQEVSVKITEGTVTQASQTEAVPAVNYEAQVINNNKMQIVMLQTQGKEAKVKADKVFESLDCT